MSIDKNKIVVLGSDHNGVELKQAIKDYLNPLDYECIDLGVFDNKKKADYVDYALTVGKIIDNHEAGWGILICGMGLGMSMAANRFPNVRAAVVHNLDAAHQARKSQDANVLCLGAWANSLEANMEIVKIWFNESFEEGRHVPRLERFTGHTGNKVVFTNGIFDVLHPGHIQLLKFAKSLGEKLIVGINSDRATKILKGEGRPVNDEKTRKAILESLDMVDEVVIFDDIKTFDIVRQLRPNILVKGGEWTAEQVRERDQVPPEIEIKVCPLVGGFSTTNTLKRVQERNEPVEYDKQKYNQTVTTKAPTQDSQTEEINWDFLKETPAVDPRLEIINSFENKRILLVGDVILDAYVYGKAVCKSLDTPTIEAEEVKTAVTYGGVGLIANNILELGGAVTLFSVVGDDQEGKYYDNFLHSKLTKKIVIDGNRKTTVKKRYWIDGYKLLQLNQVTNEPINFEIEKEILEMMEGQIQQADLIFTLDAQHGLMTPGLIKGILELSQKYNKPWYVDAQISRAGSRHMLFGGCDALFLSQGEALAIDNNFNVYQAEQSLFLLKNKLKINNVIVKLGENGSIALFNNKFIKSKPYPVQAVDTCGAGDAFLAAFSLGDRVRPEESLEIANVWAALSTTIHGTVPPEKKVLLDVYQKKM